MANYKQLTNADIIDLIINKTTFNIKEINEMEEDENKLKSKLIDYLLDNMETINKLTIELKIRGICR